jgi:hypothetical protein
MLWFAVTVAAVPTGLAPRGGQQEGLDTLGRIFGERPADPK